MLVRSQSMHNPESDFVLLIQQEYQAVDYHVLLWNKF